MRYAAYLLPQGVMHQDVRFVEVHPDQVADLTIFNQ